MANTKFKFWAGWMKASQMENELWLKIWKYEVKENKAKGMETVVFRIPKELSHDLIIEIEKLIQSK